MFNKVFLLGYLGSDPDVKFVKKDNEANSKPIALMSLATSEFSNGDTKTQWHKLVAWGKVAENCAKYLKKGSQVFVEGKVIYEKWEDAEGNPKNATKIYVERIRFLSNPSKNNSEEKIQNNFVDDIPF